MKRLLKWLGLAFLALILLIATPIAYTETMCRGTPLEQAEARYITDPAWQRAEARTYLTYPEWHIVYAYEGYAEVLKRADPHNFPYTNAIIGFWSSLCALTQKADELGKAGTDAKLTIYTIGASFTLEMLFKAAYEETIGRVASWTSDTSPQDKVEMAMAADYATFLQEIPWYKYDFDAWYAKLMAAPTEGVRSHERRIALGIEWKAKAAYARLIAKAAGAVGVDELTMRIAIQGVTPDDLTAYPEITVISNEGGIIIAEAPRYRTFTKLVEKLLFDYSQARILEIAGNDDILISLDARANPVLRDDLNVLSITNRVGFYERTRVLVAMKVNQLHTLTPTLKLSALEHIYDY
ncbi:hypothetical protein SAMN05444273_105264 [Litoreibacter ascidiaceicola]|uniref:Uncharacterized protein n=1 Tax=Litoreibacter ascidiaceicola TaxID=1486859 RepID=A0A1M5B0S6_9RHOB|nr:hypothetical protein [Litoreibacter ascidiaceicola]SHF36075.1 hypothetical protein SAMN05444273_105264 [Litoreibacter ascidiaceicola]